MDSMSGAKVVQRAPDYLELGDFAYRAARRPGSTALRAPCARARMRAGGGGWGPLSYVCMYSSSSLHVLDSPDWLAWTGNLSWNCFELTFLANIATDPALTAQSRDSLTVPQVHDANYMYGWVATVPI